MQALVVTRFSAEPAMAIEERPRPTPRDGHSIVRVMAATVNPLSHQVRSGIVAIASAPRVLSNDGAGVVEEGARFAPGTRVAIYGGAQLGISEDGLQQQWISVADDRLIELPAAFTFDEGAALPINYVTAHQALTRVGDARIGQVAVIAGASGALGHALIQTASALGLRAIGVVSSAAKVEAARAAGADLVIDLSGRDLAEAVLEATGGTGADLALDPVGGAMLGRLLGIVRPRGLVVSIGFVGGDAATIDVADVVIHEKRIHGYDAWLETDADVAAALDTIGGFIGKGLLRPAIDSTYALSSFEEAYRRLLSREATGAIVLHPHGTA